MAAPWWKCLVQRQCHQGELRSRFWRFRPRWSSAIVVGTHVVIQCHLVKDWICSFWGPRWWNLKGKGSHHITWYPRGRSRRLQVILKHFVGQKMLRRWELFSFRGNFQSKLQDWQDWQEQLPESHYVGWEWLGMAMIFSPRQSNYWGWLRIGIYWYATG